MAERGPMRDECAPDIGEDRSEENLKGTPMIAQFKLRIVLSGVIACLGSVCCGQAPDHPADKTLLEIEILMPGLPGNPLQAQKWRKAFEEVGESVRIRPPLANDAPKIDEVSRGPFRLVRIVGEIQRDGAIKFPSKSFKISQTAELKEFLGELKTFGAQGAPTGKPFWGLTRDQLSGVEAGLKSPVTRALKGLKFEDAVAAIPLTAGLQLHYHSTAELVREQWKDLDFQDEAQGLSAGTALSFVLSQAGLGFRPLRTPSGAIQLVVHPLTDAPDAWPVGWPLNDDRPRDQFVPGLFKQLETGVNESPLSAVLDVIEEQSKVRILLDRRACLAKDLDADQLLVTYPRRKTAWALIVSSVTVNAHMTMNYRQDEAGTGFIFITPFEHYHPARNDQPNARPQEMSRGQK